MKFDKMFCGKCKKTVNAEIIVRYARYKCPECKTINEVMNVSLKEYIGFNYGGFKKQIDSFIDTDDFVFLKANTEADLKAGLLNEKKINRLKKVLKNEFRTGGSIRDMKEQIDSIVRPGTRFRLKEGELALTTDGKPIVAIREEFRGLVIARTETTRIANNANINFMKSQGEKFYSWMAPMDDRTCPICENLNGTIFPVSSDIRPPAHGLCRCTTVAVVQEL